MTRGSRRLLIRNAQIVGVPKYTHGLWDIAIDAAGRIEGVHPVHTVTSVSTMSPPPSPMPSLTQSQGAPSEPEFTEVYDARGAYVSSGWIDLHCHVFDSISEYGVDAERIGPATGVTTIVDAGSAGEATFPGFKRFILDVSRARILAFLNIGSIGLIKSNISEVAALNFIDLRATLARVQEHPSIIKGIKVRASGTVVRELGTIPLILAKKCARVLGVPVMVHIGEPPPVLEEVLAHLDPGDIVTHCFNGKPGGTIFDDHGEPLREVSSALDRGVLFDVGHGAASFSFKIAEKAIARGIVPYSISTDLHVRSINGAVRDLATTMTKLLNLGMKLEDVIRSVTIHPASCLGESNLASLSPGTEANITVFRVLAREQEAQDSEGEVRVLGDWIRPAAVIQGTRILRA